MTIETLIKSKIREIADWPQKGISFKDITPLLEDKKLFSKAVDLLIAPYLRKKPDKIVGIDARGFIFAAAAAYKLKTGLVMVRKKGKLPSKTVSQAFQLEYGRATLEMHQDSISPGEKILIIDDLLATGGTTRATVSLIKKLKGKIIGIEFLVELIYLRGRKKLQGQRVRSLVKYYK